MNGAPISVLVDISAARMYRTFVALGMRHLCVVDDAKQVVGIVTRVDLERAGHGPHGHNTPGAGTTGTPRHSALAGKRPRDRLRGALWRALRALACLPRQGSAAADEDGEEGGMQSALGDGFEDTLRPLPPRNTA
jgi:hypothetical protein